MRKAFFLLCIVSLVVVMFGCDMDGDDLWFFYSPDVVGGIEGGGTTTNIEKDYQNGGFTIIMTRWADIWLTEAILTQGEAEILKEYTDFTLTLTPGSIRHDEKEVEKFQNGYQVVQRFYITPSRGSYTLVGTTTASDNSSSRTDTINLTIK